MTPEQGARADIDRLLATADSQVCDKNAAAIHAARGVAIREFKLFAGHGTAFYKVYVDGKTTRVVEAKMGSAPFLIRSDTAAHNLRSPVFSPLNISRETKLSSLGFRFGINGSHAARTMMLDELRLLLVHVPENASCDRYAQAVMDDNVLGKPTQKARELTLRHLVALYGLDLSTPIFRALRRLWPLKEAAQPMLALAIALARDPLLRGTQAFILDQPLGVQVPRESVEALLEKTHPGRFSPASLKSFAQNVAGTWTAAGSLSGRVRKVRSQPDAHPESVTLLLLLAYLEGRTGQRLFTSDWIRLLGRNLEEIEALTTAASHRGLLVFMNAAGVKEIRFPGYLTPDEDRIRTELAHVV